MAWCKKYIGATTEKIEALAYMQPCMSVTAIVN